MKIYETVTGNSFFPWNSTNYVCCMFVVLFWWKIRHHQTSSDCKHSQISHDQTGMIRSLLWYACPIWQKLFQKGASRTLLSNQSWVCPGLEVEWWFSKPVGCKTPKSNISISMFWLTLKVRISSKDGAREEVWIFAFHTFRHWPDSLTWKSRSSNPHN